MAGNALSFDYLGTYTFSGQVQERKTISPHPSWSKYDFIMIKPNLAFAKQEGQSGGNWLWYEISDGSNTHSNYDSDGSVNPRNEKFTTVLIRDNEEGKWYLCPVAGGRSASIASNAEISDITIKFGLYHGTTYAIATGKIEVYGGSFLPEGA